MAFLPGAVPDASTFTAGASPLTPIGGVWNDALAAVSSGQVAELRITEKRAAHVNLRREDGTELGTAAAPLRSQDAADGTPGSAAPTTALLAGGSDGTNLRALALDTSGRQKVLLFDGSGNPISSTTGSLNVNIVGGGGSGTAIDEAAWTAGTSPFTPEGGVFNDSAAALTSGQQGAGRQTPNRARHINVRKQDGTELGTTTNPFIVALSGAMIQPVRTVTAATDTATINDFLILDNAASNAITQKLPAGLSAAQTMLIVVKKTDSTVNVVTIDANGSTIDGAATLKLYTQNSAVALQWNGAAWSMESFEPGSWGTWTPVISGSGAMTISGVSQSTTPQFRRDASEVHFNLFPTFTVGGTPNLNIFITMPTPSVIAFSACLGLVLTPGGAWENSSLCYVDNSAPSLVLFRSAIANFSAGSWQTMISGSYRI